MKSKARKRLGILIIIATLAVIIIIAGQLLVQNHKFRLGAVINEGRNLANLLSNLPYDLLIPTQDRKTILESIKNPQINKNFAYAAIFNLDNQSLAITSSGNITIPYLPLDKEILLRSNQKILDTELDGLIDFSAPLLSNGELIGYIRIGYFKPPNKLDTHNLSFIAQLVLPIFLLVPFTYWLISSELKPLHQANDKINEALQKQHILAGESSSDNSQDFMLNFKSFMSMIDKNFEQLNSQNIKIQAAALALSYQRRRIELALQTLPEAILVMDESGTAIFTNSKLISLIGGSLDMILGSKPHDWCDNDKIIELLSKYYRNNRLLQRPESVEYFPKSNPSKTIEVSAYPLYPTNDSEMFCGTLVEFRDKTREVLANQARDEFISHVAHELKSPLNIIHLYAESLLNMQDDPNDYLINAVNTINDEIDRLTLLISNLLNITKIESGNIALNPQRIKFSDFLEDTFNTLARSRSENNIRFDLQLPRALPNIQADKDLLRIALNNLLTNAIKYNKPGGNVSLTAEESGDNIVIRVSDTGIGISEKDRTHIFDKFYRSLDSNVLEKSGHGLGLSLVKEIIELHHGNIKLESTPGVGSIFTVELKIADNII